MIGGPVWSGRISNPLMEYLNLTDFKNINVAPFWTDAGSFEGYEEDFHKFVRNGTVLNGQGFSHVSSMSDLEIKKLIEDLNVEAMPGQTVAIVGPTGCGKTTLINLLMRFYNQNAGHITIDGINTLDMQREYVRSLYGMVLQDSWLFKGTIKENIAYGCEATDDEIIEAAKNAHAHKFIIQLKDGYDAFVDKDGGNLSQGQKQLLCIARIMLTKPPMLILDEATSSIDTRTEKQIQDAFDKMMQGRTTFIVAHRLSTIQKADQILVMNHGQIIEQGNHQELLDKHGFYHHLYYSQFDLENNES